MIDGERGGMDADRGGRDGSDEKRSWPGVTKRADLAQDPAPEPGGRDGQDGGDGRVSGDAVTAGGPDGNSLASRGVYEAEADGLPVAIPDAVTGARTGRGVATDDSPPAPPAGDGPPACSQAPAPAGSQDPVAALPPAEAHTAPAADVPGGPAGRRPGAGIAGLSLPYRVVAAVALSVMGVLAVGHVAMIFLHVAPSNTVTKQHGEVIADWVYPEFEQNWKLFAPNPLQQNISVNARAEVVGADGRRTTRWIDLSREDGDAIHGNVLPSHVDQNELRRAWDFFTGSHDSQNRPAGLRGELSERYIRRIVMLRLADHDLGGRVERIQVRSAVRSLGAPPWSDEKISTEPDYREFPWWIVKPSDLPGTGITGEQASHGGGAEQ